MEKRGINLMENQLVKKEIIRALDSQTKVNVSLDGPWTGMEELIWKGYKAVEKFQYDKMLENWLSAWEQLKAIIAGAEHKPSIRNLEEATDYAYGIYNWLQDMEMELGNAKEYEKRIIFCKEVIEILTWESDSSDNYRAAIGESMNQLGQVKKCDEWYKNWSDEEPKNAACINSQIWCLVERNEFDRAKTLIEEYFDGHTECNVKNITMFMRAASLYKALGDEEMAISYEKKMKIFQKGFLANPIQYGEDDEWPLLNHKPVVKDNKIYPNELCTCGSGKKYKKCCGRN